LEININQTGTVTLTTYGKNILDGYRMAVEKATNHEMKFILGYDEEGKYSTELWSISHIFGKYLYNGAEQVFHKNIIQIEDAQD